MFGWRYKDTDQSKFVRWGYQNPINSVTLTIPGNTVKGFYVLTSFRGCVLSWLTTLNLDWGNDRSFVIYYYNSRIDTYLKHFVNAYRCVCWMKITSIDVLDGPYIRPCRYFTVSWIHEYSICFWIIFLGNSLHCYILF